MAKVLFGTTDGVSVRSFFTGQFRFLVEQGWEVHLVCNDSASVGQFCNDEGAIFHPVSMTRSPSPSADLRSVFALIRLLRTVKPDVALWATPKAGLLGAVASRVANVPMTYSVNGLRLEGATGLLKSILWLSEWLAIRLAHRVTAVGRDLRSRMESLRLARPGTIEVLANGSANGVPEPGPNKRDLRKDLRIDPKEPVVAFVGRLTEDKGLAELCQCWSTLSEAFPTIHLLVAGRVEAQQDPRADDLAERLATLPRAHILGHLDDVQPVYNAADLLVLPSYREGLPTVVLEAAMWAVPAIVTNCTGGPESVGHGEGGIVVPMRDATALTEAVRELLTNPEHRRCLGRAAKARVQRDYAPTGVWQAVDALLRETAAGHRRNKEQHD